MWAQSQMIKWRLAEKDGIYFIGVHCRCYAGVHLFAQMYCQAMLLSYAGSKHNIDSEALDGLLISQLVMTSICLQSYGLLRFHFSSSEMRFGSVDSILF